MQFHLEGSNELRLDPETAYNRLTDLELMTKALPDVEDVKVIDNDTAETTMKLRIALVSTRLRMKVKILGKTPPTHAELSAEGSGSGSHVKLSSIFDLEKTAGSTTKITWSANADITGIMAGIGSAMLKGFAEKKVGEIFEAISRAIEK
jgi:carbon monoxide dehydrogenase subunit G